MATVRFRGLALLGVVALTVVGATTLRAPEQAGAATCSSSAAGDISVAVVIDFGSASGEQSGVLPQCVQLSPRATGIVALRAAASYATDSSRKICQIAGVPATFDPINCSAPRNGTISYWAYFQGRAGGWTYSSGGPASRRVSSDVVEGWRFVTVEADGSTTADSRESTPKPRNFLDSSGHLRSSYLWQSTCIPTPATSLPGPAVQSEPRPDPIPSSTHAGSEDNSRSTGAATTTSSPEAASSTQRSGATTSTAPRSRARSSDTAARLTRDEVEAAAKASKPPPRPIGAIVAGAGGVGVVALGLVVATRRSRRRRLLDDQAD